MQLFGVDNKRCRMNSCIQKGETEITWAQFLTKWDYNNTKPDSSIFLENYKYNNFCISVFQSIKMADIV